VTLNSFQEWPQVRSISFPVAEKTPSHQGFSRFP
jgi:hypothetical protein